MADLTGMMQAAAGVGGEEADEYFQNTVLLLHGDGINGQQNNVFLDSSSNAFSITRAGNTTQGTFSPFSKPDGRWGNYFDGNGDYLTAPTDAAFAVGSVFTIEFWLYPQSYGANPVFIFLGETSGDLQFGLNSGTLSLGASGVAWRLTGSIGPTLNAWNHCVLVRSGTGTNETSIFLNGTRIANGTVTDAWTTNKPAIIQSTLGSSYQTNGYMSSVRIVKGSAVYDPADTTITVPTSPLTAVSGTSLLTCQSNRFVDNSSNAFAITAAGNVAVTPFSPFPITTAYSPSVNGGAGYFVGDATDHLTAPANAAFALGSNSFTLEAWIYPLELNTYNFIYSRESSGSWSDTEIEFQFNSSGTLAATVAIGGSPTAVSSATGAIKINQWQHVAFVKNGTSGQIYVNGAASGSAVTISGTLNNPASSPYINYQAVAGSRGMVGWLSGLRLVNGTAVYTSAFTPPTAPLTAIANTSLLCNFTNAGILDNTCFNALETVANAQIDTTTKKYGTGSMEFDGTGDWLLMPHSPDQQLGTGNFTIEFWVYLATGDTGSNRGLVAKGTSTTGFLVSLNTTEKVVFTFTTSTITSSGAITTNAWNHIAVVREGTGSNQTKIYIAGTNDGTGTVSTDFNQTSVMYVGANRTAGDPMKGFIDDLRITKGIARYTTTFTPPTAAFPNIGE